MFWGSLFRAKSQNLIMKKKIRRWVLGFVKYLENILDYFAKKFFCNSVRFCRWYLWDMFDVIFKWKQGRFSAKSFVLFILVFKSSFIFCRILFLWLPIQPFHMRLCWRGKIYFESWDILGLIQYNFYISGLTFLLSFFLFNDPESSFLLIYRNKTSLKFFYLKYCHQWWNIFIYWKTFP
jgi:hypothetical protein